MKGIITADIVGSTRIPDKDRCKLPERIQEIADELDSMVSVKLEIFRGDSFQIDIEDASKSAFVAILFRAGLKMAPLISEKKSLDARMSVGIGGIRYTNETNHHTESLFIIQRINI